jgi:ubiquinone/menaquinone biosynthesis C-methylase UbiE
MKSLDLIVYIGPGEKIPGSMYGPLVRPNERYICIDLPEGHAQPFPNIAFRIYQQLSDDLKKDVEFIGHDARNIPLEDECASEVRIYNVLSDPDVENKARILMEAKRILKSGGCLSLGETYSPEVFPFNHAYSYARLMHLHPIVIFNGIKDASDAHYLSEKIGGGLRCLQTDSYMIEAYKKLEK